MKKYIISAIALILILGITIWYLVCYTKDKNSSEGIISPSNEEQIDKNSIKYTGWLKTNGAELQNQRGEKFQLKGLSSHGIQWFPHVITYDNLKELKEEWHINVFRLAMYTDPNVNGYIAHPEDSKEFIKKVVEYAKELDLYIIIDWHILSDGNPQTYQDDAINFFDEMSKEYKNTPNVIYEICNEPNGYDVTWDSNVKPYAEEVIKTIRKNCPRALIIVGTPNWCTDIKPAADNPINAHNIVYSCHFYAGTHKKELRDDIDYCINKNIPIFISECGITNATGNGKIFEESFKEWVDYLNANNISWVFWSFCNKNESSSILKVDYKPTLDENVKPNVQNGDDIEKINSEESEISVDFEDYLTETGEIIKSLLIK